MHFPGKLLNLLSLSTLLVLTGHSNLNAETSDCLAPISGLIKPEYARLLRNKLYLTDANYLRIAILPSAGLLGEKVFSFRSGGADANRIVLTCTSADKNLWLEASDLKGGLTRTPQVNIQRLDLPFPKSLAIALKSVVEVMIQNSDQPRGEGLVTVDGTDILFAVENFGGRPGQAILVPSAAGPRVSSLRRLTDALARYCVRDEISRRRDLRQIELETTKLQSGLAFRKTKF